MTNDTTNIHIEQSILGGILLDGGSFVSISDKLTPLHFTQYQHRFIFEAMRALDNEDKLIDIITVDAKLRALKLWEDPEAFSYIASLASNATGTANLIAYADILVKADLVKKLQLTATKIGILAGDSDKYEPSEMIDQAEAMLYEIQQEAVRGGGIQRASDIFARWLDGWDTEEEQAIATGFLDLDRLMAGGLRGGELFLIAGRPGSGKTTLGMNIAEFVANTLNKTVVIFSMEMKGEALIERLVAAMADIDLDLLRKKNKKDLDAIVAKLTNVIAKISNNKMGIDSTPSLRLSELRARARREKKERPDLSLIVVDYVQLMRSDGRYDNRANEIGQISAGLKSLAKELNVPIIGLAQLNRNSLVRGDKKPTMADLRDSGNLEQDADIVALVHREELFNPTPENEGLAEIIIDKQRNGETGIFTLVFRKKYNKFVNYKRF